MAKIAELRQVITSLYSSRQHFHHNSTEFLEAPPSPLAGARRRPCCFVQTSCSIEGGDVGENAAAGQHQHLPGRDCQIGQPIDSLAHHQNFSRAKQVALHNSLTLQGQLGHGEQINVIVILKLQMVTSSIPFAAWHDQEYKDPFPGSFEWLHVANVASYK